MMCLLLFVVVGVCYFFFFFFFSSRRRHTRSLCDWSSDVCSSDLWLQERGWAVHTVFADTGGVDAEEREFIEGRAAELGAASHVTVDGGPALWQGFVKPFLMAGEAYQGQYPLLVSDRYLIVEAALARCNELGTKSIAHGCTGMGNDQVR